MEKLGLDLDVYDIWYIPFWKTQTFSLIIFVVFLLLILLLFLFLRKKKQNKVKEQLSVDDILKKLTLLDDKIKSKQYLEYHEYSEFYSELILTLKQFIFVNYGYDFFSKTEEELIIFLKTENLSTDDFDRNLKILMSNALSSKFAKAAVLKVQMEEDLNRCIDLVKLLKKDSPEKYRKKT